jgi:hypothetical protein
MPSVARALTLDYPLYSKAELMEYRRNILRYAHRFHPALNAISIGRSLCRCAPFSGTGNRERPMC